MTAPVTELIAAANQNLPNGWTLEASEVRRYKYRSLWRITAVYAGAERLWWDVYRVGAALPAIVERIDVEARTEETRVLVTVDGQDYVRSIEELP